jgi:hypothetical protein
MAFAYPEHNHLKVQKTSSNSSYITVIMHFEISPEWIIKSHEYFERMNSVNIFSFKTLVAIRNNALIFVWCNPLFRAHPSQPSDTDDRQSACQDGYKRDGGPGLM